MPERTGEDRHQSPDSRLASALEPTVEAALRRSVQDKPRAWAEAIFPILMPAIRMAVTTALRDMVQTLNQLLEYSLSLRSWRWRVEAWRTGKPFVQVLLLRTLVYRVEQVLLVNRNDGLLLASVSAPGITTKDADLVSGMLTAIQEFIQDSFEIEKNAAIRELHIGDFSLLVERSQEAILAAAVRGNAPVELRGVLQAALDLIHEEFGAELRGSRGNSQAFEPECRQILEGCLQSQYQTPEKTSYWKLWLCAASLALGLAFWGGLRIEQGRRWNRGLAALRAVPGITITQSSRHGGIYVLEGLRDPFAGAPEEVLARQGIDMRRVSLRLQPFLSLDPKLLVERARVAIQAPKSVSVSLDQDVLKLEGTASHTWILQARSNGQKLALAGIREVRTDGLKDNDLETLRAQIEMVAILFPLGSSTIPLEQDQLISAVGARVRQWAAGASAIGRSPRLEVIGRADRSGGEENNVALSQRRAQHVAEVLVAAGVAPDLLMSVGRGSATPPEQATHEEAAAETLQRSVVFRLILEPGAHGGEGR